MSGFFITYFFLNARWFSHLLYIYLKHVTFPLMLSFIFIWGFSPAVPLFLWRLIFLYFLCVCGILRVLYSKMCILNVYFLYMHIVLVVSLCMCRFCLVLTQSERKLWKYWLLSDKERGMNEKGWKIKLVVKGISKANACGIHMYVYEWSQ